MEIAYWTHNRTWYATTTHIHIQRIHIVHVQCHSSAYGNFLHSLTPERAQAEIFSSFLWVINKGRNSDNKFAYKTPVAHLLISSVHQVLLFIHENFTIFLYCKMQIILNRKFFIRYSNVRIVYHHRWKFFFLCCIFEVRGIIFRFSHCLSLYVQSIYEYLQISLFVFNFT